MRSVFTQAAEQPLHTMGRRAIVASIVLYVLIGLMVYGLGVPVAAEYSEAWFGLDPSALSRYYDALSGRGELGLYQVGHVLDVVFWFVFYPALAYGCERVRRCALARDRRWWANAAAILSWAVVIGFGMDALETSMVFVTSIMHPTFAATWMMAVHYAGKVLAGVALAPVLGLLVIDAVGALVRRAQTKRAAV